ncbi:hypothetical protein C2845_PM01G39660 [Panicum miliaceum]|uniref:Uncharacterized protein n=1 Tax=Panicum miliaceum TaxID=4540 RepID=A0A3L6TLD0_PANMI|nr:hypothetical protein C2845_PM01G39660 [Panicum miliaceum]
MHRKKQDERERMDKKVKLERGDMDRKVHMARVEMDFMIKEERGKLDKMLQEQREYLDRTLMQERDNQDRRLKEEREEMDRIIEMERVRMDSENMHARVHMDRKLQEEIHGKDINILLEEKPTKEHVKGITPQQQAIRDRIKNERNEFRDDVVMKFLVHTVGRDFFNNPKEYLDEQISVMTFTKPAKVEWYSIIMNLSDHGMKWTSDLYYLHPLREGPDGLVEILEQKQVDELMHAHEGIKGENTGLASKERLKAFIDGRVQHLTSDTELSMKRDMDSSSSSDVSWQPKKHHPDSSDDE